MDALLITAGIAEDELVATVKVLPLNVRLDSTVASFASLKVATPCAVEPSHDIPPPPRPETIKISAAFLAPVAAIFVVFVAMLAAFVVVTLAFV